MSELKIPNEFSTKQPKNKKTWQPKQIISKRQMLGLFLGFLFIPIFIYIILPIMARRHFCNYLKLPQEVFLSEPKHINLIKQTEKNNGYVINLNGYEFNIPENFTPTSIYENKVDFSNSSRSNARLIHIYTDLDDKKFKFSSFGLSKWFMPSNPASYMQLILHATWHPIRLMYKSNFYANEGLNTRVYETDFENYHRGFVYALPGQNGYTSRIYNLYGAGFVEFSIKDTVKPPTLAEWVKSASYIKTIKSIKDVPDSKEKSSYKLDKLIEQAQLRKKETDILRICLNEYFRTKSPEWIIPIAYIMKNREYYIDLNDLYKEHVNKFPKNSKEKALWDSIMEEAVSKIIKIEIDPTNRVRELNIYCRNLTQLEIEDIQVEISVVNYLGKETSFIASLVEESGKILPMLEKSIHIKPPEDINLSNAQKISCKVVKIDFLR